MVCTYYPHYQTEEIDKGGYNTMPKGGFREFIFLLIFASQYMFLAVGSMWILAPMGKT